MSLHKEVNVHSTVDISQEVLIYCDEKFNISVVVHSAPNGAELVVHCVQVTLVDEELLDEEVSKRLLLLHVHVCGKLRLNLHRQLFDTHWAHKPQHLDCSILSTK